MFTCAETGNLYWFYEQACFFQCNICAGIVLCCVYNGADGFIAQVTGLYRVGTFGGYDDAVVSVGIGMYSCIVEVYGYSFQWMAAGFVCNGTRKDGLCVQHPGAAEQQ